MNEGRKERRAEKERKKESKEENMLERKNVRKYVSDLLYIWATLNRNDGMAYVVSVDEDYPSHARSLIRLYTTLLAANFFTD